MRDTIYEMASRANSHLMKVNENCLLHNILWFVYVIKLMYEFFFQAKKLEEVDKHIKSIFLPFVPLQLYLDNLQKVDFNVFDKRLQERNHLLPMKLLWYKMFN